MKFRHVIAAALLLVLFTSCGEAKSPWITDLEEARKKSTSTEKDLLVVFTGSDANEESKTMITNVFTKKFFQTGKKKFILCNIDIVQDETLMTADAKKKNYEAATEFGIQALPSIVLLTPKGDVYGFSTANEQTATTEGFFTYLETFAEARTKLVDLRTKLDASSGLEKATNIDLFLSAINPAQRQRYADLIREFVTLDPSNTTGMLGKYIVQAAYLDAMAAYMDTNVQAAGDIFLKASENAALLPVEKQEALFMAAYMYSELETAQKSQVIGWLEKAVAIAPDSAQSAQIRQTIEGIKNAPEAPAPAPAAPAPAAPAPAK